MTQAASSLHSNLTVDDILADLALFADRTSSSATSARQDQRHPLLSLGRSLVPAECLSHSESASLSSPSDQRQNEETSLLNLLEDDSTRLRALLRSLDQEGNKDEMGAQLEIVRLFLASSGQSLASLNEEATTRGKVGTGSNGERVGVRAENRIEGLHARVARVQTDLEQLERQLEAARDALQ